MQMYLADDLPLVLTVDVVVIVEFADVHSNRTVEMIHSNIDALDSFASGLRDIALDSLAQFEPEDQGKNGLVFWIIERTMN